MPDTFEEIKRDAQTKVLMRWLVSGDTGISSETIVAVWMKCDKDRHDPPQDPSDFGRCYRLLQNAPWLLPTLINVAFKYPEWKPMIENWKELETLYKIESPSGTATKLHDRMKVLLAEGEKFASQ